MSNAPKIEKFSELSDSTPATVALVKIEENVRRNDDRRKKCDVMTFSVTVNGVEFRRTMRTPAYLAYSMRFFKMFTVGEVRAMERSYPA